MKTSFKQCLTWNGWYYSEGSHLLETCQNCCSCVPPYPWFRDHGARPAVLFEQALQVMGTVFWDVRAMMRDSCTHSLARSLARLPASRPWVDAPLYTCLHETQLTDSASHHVLHTSLLMETVLAFGDGHATSLVLFGHRAVLVNEVVCIYVRRKSS